jgi:hypothetical protein
LLFGILEESVVAAAAPPISTQNTSSAAGAGKKKGGGRQPKPENLPIRRELIDLPEEQRQGLVKIREEITEQIEYQPSSFYLLQLVRPVYAHPKKAHAPVVAALPPPGYPAGGCGSGLHRACAHCQILGMPISAFEILCRLREYADSIAESALS